MSGMDRLTELLPCPFCGDPMRVVLGNLQHTKNARDSRHDSICPIRACSWTSGSIACWNRRASQDAPAPSDGLREALADMYQCDKWSRFSFDEVKDRVRPLLAALTASPAQEGGE